MNKDAVADRLMRFETSTDYMYRTGSGEVLVGVGHSVNTASQALSIRWHGSPSNVAIVGDWTRIAGAPKGLKGGRYASLSRVRLDSATITELLNEDIGRQTAALASALPEFSRYPEAVQQALFDMAWTLGVAGLMQCSALLMACRAGDWQSAAIESRREVEESRNAEIATLLSSAQDDSGQAIAVK